MEETLTVHRLRVPEQLRRTLGCTNVIESAFSIVETVCRNVKRWRDGDHIERWVGSGLLVAERQFRRVMAIARFPRCWLRWPPPFPRSRLRKEPLPRNL